MDDTACFINKYAQQKESQHMKKLIFLILILSNEVHAVTILSEKSWITGSGTGHIEKIIGSQEKYSSGGDVAKAYTLVPDQIGYQGLQNKIGATHTFYAYNGGMFSYHKFIAKLCDHKKNCFNYEKIISIKWGEYYGETIYSSLSVSEDGIGRYPIYAESTVSGQPYAHDFKEGSLILQPFPYDRA